MSWKARLSVNLRELRVYLHPTAPGSAGVRAFLQNRYAILKQLNPSFQITVREHDQSSALLRARYDYNAERDVPVDGLTEAEILEHLRGLVAAGETMPRSAEAMPCDRDVVDSLDVARGQL